MNRQRSARWPLRRSPPLSPTGSPARDGYGSPLDDAAARRFCTCALRRRATPAFGMKPSSAAVSARRWSKGTGSSSTSRARGGESRRPSSRKSLLWGLAASGRWSSRGVLGAESRTGCRACAAPGSARRRGWRASGGGAALRAARDRHVRGCWMLALQQAEPSGTRAASPLGPRRSWGRSRPVRRAAPWGARADRPGRAWHPGARPRPPWLSRGGPERPYSSWRPAGGRRLWSRFCSPAGSLRGGSLRSRSVSADPYGVIPVVDGYYRSPSHDDRGTPAGGWLRPGCWVANPAGAVCTTRPRGGPSTASTVPPPRR